MAENKDNRSELLKKVDEGFMYFNSGRLEELKTDDKFYVEHFMMYIEHLENKFL